MTTTVEAILSSQLSDVKKYDDMIVINVIKMTTKVLEACTRMEQEEGHRWVMHTLIDKLQRIQQKWDGDHNVVERLRAARPQLRGFFDDRANGVGAANMLISELQRVLEDHLVATHHDLLVRAVVDNLGNMNWVINWEAMRACLDLHLLILIEQERINELLVLAADGTEHFQVVTSALIGAEISRLYNNVWKMFFRKVQKCLRYAGSSCSSRDDTRDVKPSGKFFLDELRRLLAENNVDDRSGKLASALISGIYQEQYMNELDGDFFSTKVPQLCKRLQDRFKLQGGALEEGQEGREALMDELVAKVGERMKQLKDERVTPRCSESCPLCWITCYLAEGHVERHDTVHQPEGLCGSIDRKTRRLWDRSCWKSLEEGCRFRFGNDGKWKPYADFDKVFPTWCKPSRHDTTSTQVREYIFYTYQHELAAMFNERSFVVHICPADKMPPQYNHSLEDLYNTLQNRLNDSYTTVARTLKCL
ncbi:hypothetical protein L7F22_047063 [Adiantum nelumboides]|nr:hypothetical protein [Adiantum nelumboides]